MNRFKHLWALALAWVAGGGLAYKFVPGFEPVKMIIFAIVVLMLGEVFYQIDKHISDRNK